MKGKSIEQRDIVEGLRKGSAKEIKYLYLEVKPKVQTYIVKNGGLATDVNDIFQVAIMAARMKLLEKGNEIVYIENYIFTSCIHEWTKKNNKKEKEIEKLDDYFYEQDNAFEELKDDKGKSLETKIFMKAFKALKADCRKLFRMKSRDFSTHEIAEEMDMTVDFVKTKKTRCKKYFMDILNNLKNNG